MMLRSNGGVTLLVIIVRPLLSAQIKLAMMLDLIFFSILLMFVIYLLDNTINFVELT